MLYLDALLEHFEIQLHSKKHAKIIKENISARFSKNYSFRLGIIIVTRHPTATLKLEKYVVFQCRRVSYHMHYIRQHKLHTLLLQNERSAIRWRGHINQQARKLETTRAAGEKYNKGAKE